MMVIEETYPIAIEVELVDELVIRGNNYFLLDLLIYCIFPLQLCHVIIMLSSLIYCKWRHCRFL